ncbi:50S ribosomal protein L18e [mine drainage metagenome]|uniref:50S ribosomal protein L18e n=1 Tax=mine drainage metagenome TaxID=410659 RepID=T0Z0Q7_9ZZZZ
MSLNSKLKSSSEIADTIDTLVKVSRENSSVIWRDVAERLAGGNRRYASINIGKINKLSKDGDVVIVPGSVLGTGVINKKVTLSALRISKSAMAKVQKSGSSFKTLKELAMESPKIKDPRIMR